ncbi:hypothetical protein D3C81_1827300 [compost metagenome]
MQRWLREDGVPAVLGQQFLAADFLHPTAPAWQGDEKPSVLAALQQYARPVLVQQQHGRYRGIRDIVEVVLRQPGRQAGARRRSAEQRQRQGLPVQRQPFQQDR